MNRAIIFAMLSIIASDQTVNAGKLDDFENEAHKPYPSGSSHNRRNKSNDDCDSFIDCVFIEPFFEPIMNDIANSFVDSVNRKQNLHNVYLTADYQDVDDNVYSNNIEFNLELTSIGFNCKNSEFKESNPNDNLRLSRCHGLYLFQRGKAFGLAFGIGGYELEGNQIKSGLSTSIPITLNINTKVSFKFTYEQYESIELIDAQFFIGKRVRLTGGYKELITGDTDLSGPYIGVAYKW